MHISLFHIKQTLQLAYPVIIGQLGIMLMGVVDTLMVGSIGAVPLAAASISNSLFILIFIIGIGVAYAVTPLAAINVGADNLSECGTLYRQALLVNIIISIVLMIFVFICADLIKFLNQPADIVSSAESYTRILGFSIIPAMLFQIHKQFIEGLSIVKPAMVVTLIANLINVFGNWLLIFGNLGFPAWGLDGAGWATFISRCFMGIILMSFVLKAHRFKMYNVYLNFKDKNLAIVKKILSLGLPSAVQYFFEVGAFTFAVIMVGWLGTEQIAAHQIVLNMASISFMFALGISAAGSIRVGNAVGRRDIMETRAAGFTAILLGASVMFIFGVIFMIFNESLPLLYIKNNRVVSLASSLLIIAALFQMSDGVQAVGIGVLRGLTDVKAPTLITFVAYWILSLPAGYLFGFVLGMQVQGVWYGFLVGLSASAIMLTIRFNIKSKKRILA